MRIILFAAALLATTPALAASGFDGTWKYDIKSANMSKTPSVTLLTGGNYTCSTCVPAYTIKADGAFHKVAGNPYYDEVSVKMVDAKSIVWSSRKGGKMASENARTVSADDKTMTTTFTDMTYEAGGPVKGTSVQDRVAAAPKGAHAVSGSWVDTTNNEVTESALLVTMKMVGKVMTLTTPTGISYTATVDGPQAPVKGDAGWTSVALKSGGKNTLVETDYRAGKAIGVYTYTLAADGKTIKADADDLLQKKKSSATIIRQ